MITRAQLKRQRQSLDVLHDARRQAGKLVKQAQGEADAIHQQAFSEGYQEGLLASAALVAHFLAQERQLAVDLQHGINEHARELLSSALNHPDILLELMDEWLATLPDTTPPDVLELLVPEVARKSHVAIKQKMASVWPGKFVLAYHDDYRFLMKYGDQLAEFDAEAFMSASMQRLVSVDTLPEQCRQLSESALSRLYDIFSQFAPEDNRERGE
ncbi:hypothetical protein ABK905_03275 [Acerihabitans sp. KWT182]|uniref:Oxygen-regulated invasion protein OrgB n=1 Tax=Acerihabitans sp. KWT182 TaxID=3157919 RepID=A0AAU7QBS8_9GAMM